MSRTLKISALALIGVMILWACGGVTDPKTTGENFLKAYLSGDFSGAKPYGTQMTKQALDALAGDKTSKDADKADLSKLVIGEVKEEGDNATLSYKYDGKDHVLKMKKEGSSYLVHMDKSALVELKGGSAGDIGKQLGETMGEALGGLKEGMDSLAKGMEEGLEGKAKEESHEGHNH